MWAIGLILGLGMGALFSSLPAALILGALFAAFFPAALKKLDFEGEKEKSGATLSNAVLPQADQAAAMNALHRQVAQMDIRLAQLEAHIASMGAKVPQTVASVKKEETEPDGEPDYLTAQALAQHGADDQVPHNSPVFVPGYLHALTPAVIPVPAAIPTVPEVMPGSVIKPSAPVVHGPSAAAQAAHIKVVSHATIKASVASPGPTTAPTLSKSSTVVPANLPIAAPVPAATLASLQLLQVTVPATVAPVPLTVEKLASAVPMAPATATNTAIIPVKVSGVPPVQVVLAATAGTSPTTPVVVPQAARVISLPVPSAVPVPAAHTAPPALPLPHVSPVLSPTPRPLTLPPPPPPPPKPPVPLRDRLPAPISKLIFGGNMLVKLGVLILFLGLAFLLRYTAERVTVPIELRYASVALVGAVLLGLGWFLRKRRASYGLILQGAGIGVFYLTTLGAMKLHELLPPTAGFGFLLAVAVLSALLAVLQNSPVLAVVAALEGFAAPVLASTGSNQAIGLFTYLLVLDVGIFLVAWFKAWRVLNLIGITGTFTLATGWAHRYYSPEQYSTVQPFLIVFFVLFAIIGLLFARRTLFEAPDDKPSLTERAGDTLRRVGRVDSTLVFGGPMAAFGLQYVLVKPWEFGAAFSAMGFAAFYLLLGRLVFATQPRGLRLLAEAYAIGGVIFGTLAIPLGFEGQWTGAAWAIEAAGMYWLGVRQSRPYARAFSFALLAGSVVQLLRATSVDMMHSAGPALLHGSFIGPMLVAAGALSMWTLLRRARLEHGYKWESMAGALLPWIGMGALTMLPWQALAPAWAAVATSLLALALRLDLKPLRVVVYVMQAFAFAATAATLHLGAAGQPLLDASFTAILLLGLSLLITWRLHSRAVFGISTGVALLADLWLPWAGMAALTALPWIRLMTSWAAVATIVMALLAYAAAIRWRLALLRPIVHAMQALSTIAFATTLAVNGPAGQPLIQGSLAGALVAGVCLLAAWVLQRRFKLEGGLDKLAGVCLPWLGMAALTLLPWLCLMTPGAAVGTATMALAACVVAVRWQVAILRSIVYGMQALGVLAFMTTLVLSKGFDGAFEGPIVQGSFAGTLILGVCLLAVWVLQRRVKPEGLLDKLATAFLPWVGMAAITLLPWLVFAVSWAAVVTVFMAVATFAIALRLGLDALRPVAYVMQALAVAFFASTIDLGAVGEPLLEGSVIGALLMGIALLMTYALYRRTPQTGFTSWETLAGPVLLWTGMAALTSLPWLSLGSPWAAPGTALLALVAFTVAVRFKLQPLRPVVHVMQTLAVVAFVASLQPSAGDVAGQAALASGWQGMLAAGLIALSVLATAAWSMRRAHLDTLFTGKPPVWSTPQTVGILAGVILLHLAILFGADLSHAALIWPFTAVLVLWIALRMQHPLLAALAILVHGISAVLFTAQTPHSGALRAFAHLGFWTSLALGLTALVAANWIRAQARATVVQPLKGRTNPWCAKPLVLWASLLWGLFWWVIAAMGEVLRVLSVNDCLDYLPAATVALVLLTSIVTHFVSVRRDWRQLGLVTLATLPALMLAAGSNLLANTNPGSHQLAFYLPSTGLGWLAWPLALVWHLRLLHAQMRLTDPAKLSALHVAGLWFFLLLAARECQWQFGRLGDALTSWSLLGWVLVPVLLLWFLRSTMALRRWPVTQYRRAYLEVAMLPVVVYLSLWCWVSNIVSPGQAAPLPFVSLLNPLEIAQWLVLAALLLWWKALPANSTLRLPSPVVKGAALLTSWALLTGMVLRACHHYADVPWSVSALYASTLTQAALSLAWATCGVVAMVLGNRRGKRVIWIVGGVLLGVVVAKLFFVELADRGGLFRIVSFLGVGVLLLLVGYFAPVPTAGESAAKPAEAV